MSPDAVARITWGTTLVAAPQLVLRATGEDSTELSRAVLRVLGSRHVAQGLAVLADPGLRRPGGVVDLLHATTAFGFAALDPRWRRTALLSGASATAFGLRALLGGRY